MHITEYKIPHVICRGEMSCEVMRSKSGNFVYYSKRIKLGQTSRFVCRDIYIYINCSGINLTKNQ